MTCKKCGGEWFVEEVLIRVAAKPSVDKRLRTTAREIRYRLKCAKCGTLPESEKEPSHAKENGKPENDGDGGSTGQPSKPGDRKQDSVFRTGRTVGPQK